MILFELHDEKDNLIFPIRRAMSPSFTALLQDDGTATFSLLRSDPQVSRIKEGHIIHVYVDNNDVFTWVVEDIAEAYGESGNDLITFTGRDTRVMLDYALVYPDGWPPTNAADPRLPVYGASILRNGDFETDGHGDPAPYWSRYESGSITYENSVGNGTVRENDKNPTKSLRITSNAVLSPTLVLSQHGLFNSNQTRSDGTSKWRITAAVRATNIEGQYVEAKIALKWFDTRGNLLGFDEDNLNQSLTWERLEKTIVVGADANQFRYEVYIGGKATFDFDLMQLEAVYDDTLPTYPIAGGYTQFTYGPNLVQNPNFDGIIVRQKPPSQWNFFPEIPVNRIMAPIYAYHTEGRFVDNYPHSGFSIDRGFPEQEGLVAWQDIPVEEGKGYHLSAVLAALYTSSAGIPIESSVERTWFRRTWLDHAGNPIEDIIYDKAAVISGIQREFMKFTAARRYEFPTKVAPYGARKLRIEILAPPNVSAPMWSNIELKRGSASVVGDLPGVTKTYIKARIPVIIEDLLLETNRRLGNDFPIRPGVMEYNRDYDIYDGVLIPKDEVAAIQYRFDHLGSVVRSLALTGEGDLTLRAMSPVEREAANGVSYLVCDYRVQAGTDKSDVIAFREGKDVIDVPEKSHSVRDVRTRLIVEGEGNGMSAVTTVVDDLELQAKYGIREGFVDQKNSVHYMDLRRIGRSIMKDLDLQTQVFSITVSTHRYKPFVDYFLGDSVSVVLPHIGLNKKYRIMGITATPTDGNDLDTVTIDLDSAAYDSFTRVAKAQQNSVSAIGAIQRLPQGSVTLYQVNGEDDLDKDHGFDFRFYVPNTPLFTHQIRLAFQGLPFRSNVRIVGDGKLAPAGAVQPKTMYTSIWDGDKQLPAPNANSSSNLESISNITIIEDGGATRNDPGGISDRKYDTGPTIDLTHGHTVLIPGIPAHNHNLNLKVEYGLFESTKPENLKAKVNGVLLDPNVYGYTDDGTNDLEIGSLIKKGWNTVSFSSTRLGRVTVQVVIQTYLSNQINAL